MRAYKDSNGLTRSAALYVPADRVRNPSSGRSLCAKVGIVACDLSGLAHSPLQGHFIDDWGWAGNAIEVAETRERILNGRARFADLAALLGIDGVTMEERRDSGRSLFEEAACRASLELRPASATVPTVCSTVRYVHLATGEFINVGAVAWGRGTLAWRFASNLGRARAFQDDEIVRSRCSSHASKPGSLPPTSSRRCVAGVMRRTASSSSTALIRRRSPLGKLSTGSSSNVFVPRT